MRRSRAASVGDRSELIFDGLRLDLSGRTVWLDGREIETTAREFELLVLLAARPEVVFTRHQLLRDVWKSNDEWQRSGWPHAR